MYRRDTCRKFCNPFFCAIKHKSIKCLTYNVKKYYNIFEKGHKLYSKCYYAHPACLSAQDGVDIKALLKEIFEKQVYKNDYESITSSLLFENVEYEAAIKTIENILDSDFL